MFSGKQNYAFAKEIFLTKRNCITKKKKKWIFPYESVGDKAV